MLKYITLGTSLTSQGTALGSSAGASVPNPATSPDSSVKPFMVCDGNLSRMWKRPGSVTFGASPVLTKVVRTEVVPWYAHACSWLRLTSTHLRPGADSSPIGFGLSAVLKSDSW